MSVLPGAAHSRRNDAIIRDRDTGYTYSGETDLSGLVLE